MGKRRRKRGDGEKGTWEKGRGKDRKRNGSKGTGDS
jgi:hypothetical protein